MPREARAGSLRTTPRCYRRRVPRRCDAPGPETTGRRQVDSLAARLKTRCPVWNAQVSAIGTQQAAAAGRAKDEATTRRKAAEVAARQRVLEAIEQQKAAAAAQKRAADEFFSKQKAAEEERRKKQAEEEAAAKRKAEEEKRAAVWSTHPGPVCARTARLVLPSQRAV